MQLFIVFARGNFLEYLASQHALPCRFIFCDELIDIGARGPARGDRPDALTTAPDVLPGFFVLIAAGTEVHFRGVALGEVVGVHARSLDRRFQVIAVYAGEEVGVDDVIRAVVDNGVLIGVAGVRFIGRNKGRTNIAEVGAHGFRGEDRIAGRDRAGEGDRPVEPLADFLHEGERRNNARMTARAGGDSNEAICALINSLVGKGIVDDVVEDDAAIGVDRLINFFAGAELANNDWDLVFHARFKVAHQPVI